MIIIINTRIIVSIITLIDMTIIVDIIITINIIITISNAERRSQISFSLTACGTKHIKKNIPPRSYEGNINLILPDETPLPSSIPLPLHKGWNLRIVEEGHNKEKKDWKHVHLEDVFFFSWHRSIRLGSEIALDWVLGWGDLLEVAPRARCFHGADIPELQMAGFCRCSV